MKTLHYDLDDKIKFIPISMKHENGHTDLILGVCTLSELYPNALRITMAKFKNRIADLKSNIFYP